MVSPMESVAWSASMRRRQRQKPVRSAQKMRAAHLKRWAMMPGSSVTAQGEPMKRQSEPVCVVWSKSTAAMWPLRTVCIRRPKPSRRETSFMPKRSRLSRTQRSAAGWSSGR